MDSFHLLSASLTPVSMISACGLVTLALYNRLGAILARIRGFHSQKMELLGRLNELDVDEQRPLLEMLDSQIEKVTEKARMIQKGLACLLGSIAVLLICALLAEAAALHESIGMVALGMGFVGLSLFLVGLIWAMRELMLSLTPLEEESAYLEVLTARRIAKSERRDIVKFAGRA